METNPWTYFTKYFYSFFHLNSNSIWIFSRPHLNKVINTKLCTCHHSKAVMASAIVCGDFIAWDEIGAYWKSLNYEQKLLVKCAPHFVTCKQAYNTEQAALCIALQWPMLATPCWNWFLSISEMLYTYLQAINKTKELSKFDLFVNKVKCTSLDIWPRYFVGH